MNSRTSRKPLTPVAAGNYLYGYRGELVRHYDTDRERVTWRCSHLHRTTHQARACALRRLAA